ncbi:FUSC family protein [Bradyrhizobium cajani]|uniref:FUSC family protein n=1 Tax=Bradyrhizobium cajani TaxID=1928661 RepID=A0A844TB20_9BRAD|nr:FUSC family protein [Bradyrhizobium cajani]MCP3368000.1 FUSC family protein [Bradyrhizobium cajani]MVT71830.1 FUSC family protein [Bradyrhizobium cajani]
MPGSTTNTADGSRAVVFAGFPVSSWVFALRVWLAMLLALYVSFWLELESPSSAALTVAVLALPTRGQGMEKAGYRLFATALGVAASIAIAGMFSQTGGLLLAVFGIWIGLCVYVAGMLDGNRAYAAALCCITVALIAIEQIDSPLQVFPTGVARGAAIGIGVLAVALVNEVLAAPDYHPVLASRLEALHRRVTEFAQAALRGEASSTTSAADMLRDIAALHPEIASLTTESSIGAARTAAARSAMVDLVGELSLARALAAVPAASATAGHDAEDGGSSLMTICRAQLRSEIMRRNADVRDSLAALRAGTHPLRQWRASLYRSRRIAAEGAVRAAIHFTLIAIIFVMAGWPTTELCLALAAVIIGLSATAPDPRAFTKLAVLAMPIACLLAGILKYLVFNGVSEFQLLAIGLAPVVIGTALLISLPSRALSPLGRLTLVFTLAVLAPSNPQSYDPEVFLVTCLFAQLSSVLVFAAQLLLPSLSGDRRIRLLLDEARRELSHPRARHLAPEEAAFREAARIEQILTANGGTTASPQVIVEAMRCFDQAVVLRRCCAELDRLAEGPLAAAAHEARAALARRDGRAILAAAEALRRTAAQAHAAADPVLAALVPAGIAFAPSQTPAQG